MLPINFKEFISLDELLQELAADDPDLRLNPDDHDSKPRSDFEGDLLARATLLQCEFSELRPVTFWHPMPDDTVTVNDVRDDFWCVVIQVQLGAGHAGYGLTRIFDFLKDRTIRWPREAVAKQLTSFGVRVPISIAGHQAKPGSTSEGAVHGDPVPAGVQAKVESDPQRRLQVLRDIGGSVLFSCGEWKIKGITRIVNREAAEGRKRSNQKTIRIDLKEAAEKERDARRQGSPPTPWPT